MNKKEENYSVTYKQIDAEYNSVRLDRYLNTQFKLPKTYIYKLIRTGQIRVNQKRIPVQYRLQTNDTVRIPPLKQTDQVVVKKPTTIPQQYLKQLEQSLLYEDEKLIVINKVPHLSTQGGSGIVHSLDTILPQFRAVEFIQPAHRIDQATTGCLIIAKRRSTIRALHEQFRNRSIQKHYLAICKHPWPNNTTLVNQPLGDAVKDHQTYAVVDENGKPAFTQFKVLAQNALGSLCQINIKTGRKHQIRAHAQHAGHPILGDNKYGDFNWNKQYPFSNHLFLHASEIIFTHPSTDQTLHIKAPIPLFWQQALQGLRLDQKLTNTTLRFQSTSQINNQTKS